jgi:hypothetical protein
MKSVIKAIVFFIVGLTVIFYGGAYMLPGTARVERSIDIASSPDKVFAIAANLRRMPEWSPWIEVDPQVKFAFEGPEQGVGQVMRWTSGNPMVGSGTLKLTEASPNTRFSTSSEYAGFGASTAAMSFAPEGAGTRVTWVFESSLPGVIDRWAGLGIDRSVGAEYEKGLAKLKAVAEMPGN